MLAYKALTIAVWGTAADVGVVHPGHAKDVGARVVPRITIGGRPLATGGRGRAICPRPRARARAEALAVAEEVERAIKSTIDEAV